MSGGKKSLRSCFQTDLSEFSVHFEDVPAAEVDRVLGTFLRSFNVVSLVIRKRGSWEEDP